jgi:acyl-coenzyme A thioesterase PaaI-like protein
MAKTGAAKTGGMKVIEQIRAGAQTPPAGITTLKLDRGFQWIESVAPGRVVARWTYDPAYDNLENATIAGWIACLAEQVMFYATNTLIEAGEVTRTTDLRLTYLENITKGVIRFEGWVERYADDTMWVECRFTDEAGTLLVKGAEIIVVRRT